MLPNAAAALYCSLPTLPDDTGARWLTAAALFLAHVGVLGVQYAAAGGTLKVADPLPVFGKSVRKVPLA